MDWITWRSIAPLQYDKLKVDYPIDLRLVAECVDSTAENIQALNPALLRMTTPKEGSYELKLPAGTADKFQTAIAAIPRENRVSWRYHRVKTGESLTEIARQYHTTAASIAEVNSLDDQELKQDTKLIIPISARRAAEMDVVSYSKHRRCIKSAKVTRCYPSRMTSGFRPRRYAGGTTCEEMH